MKENDNFYKDRISIELLYIIFGQFLQRWYIYIYIIRLINFINRRKTLEEELHKDYNQRLKWSINSTKRIARKASPHPQKKHFIYMVHYSNINIKNKKDFISITDLSTHSNVQMCVYSAPSKLPTHNYYYAFHTFLSSKRRHITPCTALPIAPQMKKKTRDHK